MDRPRRLAVSAHFPGTPEVDEASPEFVLPPVESGTWVPVELTLRVAESGGAPEIALESYTGDGAFVPVAVGDVAVVADDHEASAALSVAALPAGAKVRFVCTVPGTATGFCCMAVFQEGA